MSVLRTWYKTPPTFLGFYGFCDSDERFLSEKKRTLAEIAKNTQPIMSFWAPFTTLATLFLDIFVPHCCSVCGRPYSLVCPRCMKSLDFCTQLEAAVYYPTIPLFSVCRYTPSSQAIVHAYKYKGVFDLGAVIAASMYRSIPLPRVDTVTAVPPDPGRKKRRGFDHTETIAMAVARHLGIPYTPLLRKKHQTESQVHTGSKLQRQKNNQQNFELLPLGVAQLEPASKLLLVDDVCTTGTTLSQCHTLLTQAGFECSCVVFSIRI